MRSACETPSSHRVGWVRSPSAFVRRCSWRLAPGSGASRSKKAVDIARVLSAAGSEKCPIRASPQQSP